MNIKDAQDQAWANRLAKGFDTTDVPWSFCGLYAEVAEAYEAWKGRSPSLGEELADVAIFLLGLAEMTGVDLDAAVGEKLAKNAQRVYERDTNGVMVRIK